MSKQPPQEILNKLKNTVMRIFFFFRITMRFHLRIETEPNENTDNYTQADGV